jgi:hypothetical protein
MLENLEKINEWWETGKIPAELVPQTKRNLFSQIADTLDDRRIVAIIGPRRTGKTTLMFQLMDMLIREKGIDPRHILFFSCDDIELREKKELIGDVIKTYFEDFLRQDYREEKCYVFIDEIHWVRDWQLWLKKYYDMKYNIKFIITGSSSAKIKREQKESLTGRMSEFTLYPMTFREFLKFNNVDTGKNLVLKEMSLKGLELERQRYGPKLILEIKKLLDEYLLTGGLPEWFETKNLSKWQKKLREDIIKRVVYDDIAMLYSVKTPSKIEALIKLLSALQSRAYSYNSLANTLGIDNETAGQYVSYLKESHIIFETMNYAASVEKQLRKNYKFVIFDSGIRNAIERVRTLTTADTGYIIEGSVQQHFLWNTQGEAYTVFYWREKEEVDVVIKTDTDTIPVEVKYRSKITASDLEGLAKFISKYKSPLAMVITKDTLELRKIAGTDVLFISAWLFLSVI